MYSIYWNMCIFCFTCDFFFLLCFLFLELEEICNNGVRSLNQSLRSSKILEEFQYSSDFQKKKKSQCSISESHVTWTHQTRDLLLREQGWRLFCVISWCLTASKDNKVLATSLCPWNTSSWKSVIHFFSLQTNFSSFTNL